MQIIKQVLYHDFSTLHAITHQEQYFCCVTLYYVVSYAAHEGRPQPSLFHIIWHVLVLQSSAVKLLEFMEEPMGQNCDPKCCCF